MSILVALALLDPGVQPPPIWRPSEFPEYEGLCDLTEDGDDRRLKFHLSVNGQGDVRGMKLTLMTIGKNSLPITYKTTPRVLAKIWDKADWHGAYRFSEYSAIEETDGIVYITTHQNGPDVSQDFYVEYSKSMFNPQENKPKLYGRCHSIKTAKVQ